MLSVIVPVGRIVVAMIIGGRPGVASLVRGNRAVEDLLPTSAHGDGQQSSPGGLLLLPAPVIFVFVYVLVGGHQGEELSNDTSHVCPL